MEQLHVKRDDLIAEEENSDDGSPEVDTDLADDAYRVSDSEIIEFEADSQDDCLDAIFCQLVNLYLRVGALCQRGVGQWVLKSLNSIANAPEEVQNASVIVVEIPYALLNTIIPPYRNQVTAGGMKKTRFKKSATVKFRKGLSKTAGFFVKTQPAPQKMHNSLAVLNFGRGKSAKFMYMASLDILSYRLLSLPGTDRNVATHARIFATGLGPNCLMPQIAALMSSKGLVGNPAMHVMDATGPLGDANKDKLQEQFAYALAASLGKRPIAPAPRAVSSGSMPGAVDTASAASPRQQQPQQPQQPQQAAARPGQVATNILLNPIIQRQLQLAWYQNLMAGQRNQKPALQNALMMRMMFPQGFPGAGAEGSTEQAEGDAAAAGNAASTAAGIAAPSDSAGEGAEEGADAQDANRLAAARSQGAHPLANMMPRPFAPAAAAAASASSASTAATQPPIAPRGSLLSKLMSYAQKKVGQLTPIQFVFELAQSGFPRVARFLLAVCASTPVATARDLLMQVTEEQLEKFLQEDRQHAGVSQSNEFDQSLQVASSLIGGDEPGKEGGDATAAGGEEGSEPKGRGKRRARGKKGRGKESTTDDNLLQQLAMAAAIAQKKDTEPDEEGESGEGSEGGDDGEARKPQTEETVGGLLEWLSSAMKEDAVQPRDYPWGRRGRASTSALGEGDAAKSGRGSKRTRGSGGEEETENGQEASGEIEIDVQTGEIVNSHHAEGGDEEGEDSEGDEPGNKRVRRGKGRAAAKTSRR